MEPSLKSRDRTFSWTHLWEFKNDELDEGFQQCPLLRLAVGCSATTEEWKSRCRSSVGIISPPDLCHNSYNLIPNRGGEGDMKVFSSSFLPPLCSHQPRPRTPPLDYHRSSFLFCFSPRVPIQSIFISPSVPFTTAFISTPSLNLRQLLFLHNPSQSFHELSDKFALTSSTFLSSFSSFFQPHMPYFSFDCPPPQIFLAAFLSTHSLPLCQMHHLSLQSQQSSPWTN